MAALTTKKGKRDQAQGEEGKRRLPGACRPWRQDAFQATLDGSRSKVRHKAQAAVAPMVLAKETSTKVVQKPNRAAPARVSTVAPGRLAAATST